jgi:hypothetical protein
VAPEVAGSIPVSHPCRSWERSWLSQRSVAQVVEHRSPKPGVAGSSPAGPVWGTTTALSSRGLGRGPLKAQTRVRIPLALLAEDGPIVYRLGRDPFKVQRGVRLPLGLFGAASSIGRASDS